MHPNKSKDLQKNNLDHLHGYLFYTHQILVTHTKIILYIFIFCIASLLYVPSVNIWAYGDDFNHLSRAVASTRWTIFSVNSFAFRPIENFVNAINVAWLGFEVMVFTHAVAIVGFIASAIMIFQLARFLAPGSRLVAIFAAFYFVVAPINALSLIQIDTISQQYATVFTLLTLLWVLRQSHSPNFGYYIVFGLISLLAMLSKETSIGLALAIPFITSLFIVPPYIKSSRLRLKHLVLSSLTIGMALTLYLSLRTIGGATFSQGERYSLSFDIIQIIKNIAQLLFGIVYAGSTVDILPRLQIWRVMVSGGFTLILSLIALIGLVGTMVETRKNKTSNTKFGEILAPNVFQDKLASILGLSLLVLAGTFPVVLTGRMSELYTYSSFPFFALLLGLLSVQGLRAAQSILPGSQGYLSKIFMVFIIATIVWLAFGTREKVDLALDISNRARSYFEQTDQWIANIPQDQVTLCWETNNQEELAYSGFVMPDRTILRGVFSFIDNIHTKSIEYIEDNNNSLFCGYEVAVRNDTVLFTRLIKIRTEQ